MVSTQFYTPVELAKLLNLSRSTIDRKAKAGEIPGRMTIGAQVRFFKPEIDRWIVEQIEKEWHAADGCDHLRGRNDTG